MIRSFISNLSKLKLTQPNNVSSFLESSQVNKLSPKFILPIEQSNEQEMETMMNKTSKKVLKKHRKRQAARKAKEFFLKNTQQ
ncbi:hypothetical protein DLAC_09969 [Tieghemostelium lacteum]|uniref:Uncharacterized protein n=1 Tax=Tieghemostelium lacteum TaxID=361077 RepID=A0A151Z5S6_TIELA|nr:hypothetical protein DLAC_09969 [Tieghemostelium lacteum]|eukprot:KYQ89310.1 hypothetical protein DLAC_09969 [Tieghemostelium lacteum]